MPKMSARSGLVRKKSRWPYLGPSQTIFSIGRKNAKKYATFVYFSLVGPLLLSTRGGGVGILAHGLKESCKTQSLLLHIMDSKQLCMDWLKFVSVIA